MCCYKNNQPCTCGGTCTSCQRVSSDTVLYTGPNLPNTGINFNDSLTVILQKLDALVGGLQAGATIQTTTTTTTV